MNAPPHHIMKEDFTMPPNSTTPSSSMALADRFWSKVNFNGPLWDRTPCWLWTAGTCRGYGRIWVQGRDVYAHRMSYELLRAPIPDGLTIDHLCRVRHCVNPAHLEPITNRENILRGVGASAQHARKTHCLRGHPFDEANTFGGSRGKRECRECHRMYQRRDWRTKKRLEAEKLEVGA